MIAQDEVCKRCAFWSNCGDIGECRRHAPTRSESHGVMTAKWPETRPWAWCGDYKANPEVV